MKLLIYKLFLQKTLSQYDSRDKSDNNDKPNDWLYFGSFRLKRILFPWKAQYSRDQKGSSSNIRDIDK